MVNYALFKNMILLFDGFPEMFVLRNICYFRNPVGLVLVLVGIIESWTGHYQHLWGFLVLLMLQVCVSVYQHSSSRVGHQIFLSYEIFLHPIPMMLNLSKSSKVNSKKVCETKNHYFPCKIGKIT